MPGWLAVPAGRAAGTTCLQQAVWHSKRHRVMACDVFTVPSYSVQHATGRMSANGWVLVVLWVYDCCLQVYELGGLQGCLQAAGGSRVCCMRLHPVHDLLASSCRTHSHESTSPRMGPNRQVWVDLCTCSRPARLCRHPELQAHLPLHNSTTRRPILTGLGAPHSS